MVVGADDGLAVRLQVPVVAIDDEVSRRNLGARQGGHDGFELVEDLPGMRNPPAILVDPTDAPILQDRYRDEAGKG